MTSSPRVGVVRDSMSTNPLLIKAPLGESRSRGLSLPGPGFTFGTCNLMRDGGVAEALSSWRVQPPPQTSASVRPMPLDFLSLNRAAVGAGLVTSQELRHFRAQRGGAKAPPQERGGGAKAPPQERRGGGASTHTTVPDITFGITARPSSPLADLLSHQFARRWRDERLSHKQQQQQHKFRPGADTRTSLLRKSRPLPVSPPAPRPRVTQVQPSVDSFRREQSPAAP